MAKQIKTTMDNFALGSSKSTVHVLVSILDEKGVSQRAWCGAPLFEEPEDSVNAKTNGYQVWDLKVTAFQVKALDKRVCKKCAHAAGNKKLMCHLQEEMDKIKIDS